MVIFCYQKIVFCIGLGDKQKSVKRRELEAAFISIAVYELDLTMIKKLLLK